MTKFSDAFLRKGAPTEKPVTQTEVAQAFGKLGYTPKFRPVAFKHPQHGRYVFGALVAEESEDVGRVEIGDQEYALVPMAELHTMDDAAEEDRVREELERYFAENLNPSAQGLRSDLRVVQEPIPVSDTAEEPLLSMVVCYHVPSGEPSEDDLARMLRHARSDLEVVESRKDLPGRVAVLLRRQGQENPDKALAAELVATQPRIVEKLLQIYISNGGAATLAKTRDKPFNTAGMVEAALPIARRVDRSLAAQIAKIIPTAAAPGVSEPVKAVEESLDKMLTALENDAEIPLLKDIIDRAQSVDTDAVKELEARIPEMPEGDEKRKAQGLLADVKQALALASQLEEQSDEQLNLLGELNAPGVGSEDMAATAQALAVVEQNVAEIEQQLKDVKAKIGRTAGDDDVEMIQLPPGFPESYTPTDEGDDEDSRPTPVAVSEAQLKRFQPAPNDSKENILRKQQGLLDLRKFEEQRRDRLAGDARLAINIHEKKRLQDQFSRAHESVLRIEDMIVKLAKMPRKAASDGPEFEFAAPKKIGSYVFIDAKWKPRPDLEDSAIAMYAKDRLLAEVARQAPGRVFGMMGPITVALIDGKKGKAVLQFSAEHDGTAMQQVE